MLGAGLPAIGWREPGAGGGGPDGGGWCGMKWDTWVGEGKEVEVRGGGGLRAG